MLEAALQLEAALERAKAVLDAASQSGAALARANARLDAIVDAVTAFSVSLDNVVTIFDNV
jgi:hypothetical protein